MKKRFYICLLIITIALTGCGKEKTELSDDNLNQVENQNIEQYYDSSRIKGTEKYTLSSASKKFSFVQTYQEYPETSDDEFVVPTNKEIIYTYAGTDENVKFNNSSEEYYYFNYNVSESDSLYISIKQSEYTKDNYKQKIDEYNNDEYSIENNYQFVILKEEDNYVLYKSDYSYSTYYYLVKFFSDGRGLKAEYNEDPNSSYAKGEEVAYNSMKAVLETIVEDTGEPLLKDKIVTIQNFNNQKIISYKYIYSVEAGRESISLVNGSKNLRVSFSSSNYSYSSGNWTILSSEDPYITVNKEQMVYKVVIDGLPQYYEYNDYGNDDSGNPPIKADGTLKGLNSVLKYFYK